jgi:DNA-binding MarR family transcriptional regulator
MSLAESAGLDKMSASKVLRNLEQLGLIIRKDNPIDSRAKVIELTKTGSKTLEAATETFQNFDDEFFKKLKNEKKFRKAISDLNKFNEKN